MIGWIIQVMRLRSEHFAWHTRRWRPATFVTVTALFFVCVPALAASPSQSKAERRLEERLEEARRKEGEALVRLADAAMSGRAVASDFAIAWRNDFLKAQPGTLVPFTVTVDGSKLSVSAALMYVRAARRGTLPSQARGAQTRYPFDSIFPIDLNPSGTQPVRITRGFAVPPGEYDIYVALRERPPDPLTPSSQPLKVAVLKQPLTVPDFWTDELATSTVILADRIEVRPGAIPADDVLEQPYVIGQQEVFPAPEARFGRDRELIVVFLIYNPSVTAEKDFDVQVDYHLYRLSPGRAGEPPGPPDHPASREGERYVTRMDPQRFNRALMGPHFDPSAGHPVMAGQGILLSSFQAGEYRLGITVTDRLSRRTLSRDVTFTVVGL